MTPNKLYYHPHARVLIYVSRALFDDYKMYLCYTKSLDTKYKSRWLVNRITQTELNKCVKLHDLHCIYYKREIERLPSDEI